MNQQKQAVGTVRVSDVAIDGLLAGVAAGIAMAIILELTSLITGASLGSMLARLDPSGTLSSINGLLAHIAVSGIYGLVFGIVYKMIRSRQALQSIPDWLLGLIYGALLLLASQILSNLNQSRLGDIPLLYLLAAHLVYGLALGWLVGRHEQTL